MVRRGRPPNEGLWSVPGGRIERGETTTDAVRREVHEETRVRVDVGRPAGSVVLPGLRPGDTYLVTDYFATVTRGTSHHTVAGDDAADARWVTRGEFVALDLTPGLADSLEAWKVWA